MIYFFILLSVIVSIWLALKIYSKEEKRPIEDDFDFMLSNPPFGESWDKFEP
jgi:type I restriction-modification system DNA methylase subunit